MFFLRIKNPQNTFRLTRRSPYHFLLLYLCSLGLNHTYQNVAGKKWISNSAFPPVISYSWSCGFDDRFVHARSIHSFTRNLIEPQLLPEREIQNIWSIYFFSFSVQLFANNTFFHLIKSYHLVSFS